MKKIIAFILCLATCFFMTSCTLFGGEHSEHTFKSSWKQNTAYHWHECKYRDCNVHGDEGAHTFENGKCTVCGHEIQIIVPGDADGDGEVTYLDAMLALQAAVGLTEASLDACDADGDGTITYLDAMLILPAAVGLIILS